MCFYLARMSMPAAVYLFTVLMGQEHGVSCVREFIERTVDGFLKTGSAHANYKGREPKLPDDVARQCVIELLSGYWVIRRGEEAVPGGRQRVEPVQRYYTSIADAARRSSLIRSVLEEYEITQGTLLRALQRVAPGLRKRHLNPKKCLSRMNRDERVEFCEKLLQMRRPSLMRFLARCFWIDAKTFYIEPSGRMVYAPEDANLTVEDARMPTTRREVKKVHYYAVVNALLGPVYIEYCTGTTAHEGDVMRPSWAPEGIPVYKAYQVGTVCVTYCHMSLCASPHLHFSKLLSLWQPTLCCQGNASE